MLRWLISRDDVRSVQTAERTISVVGATMPCRWPVARSLRLMVWLGWERIM
jgi:hypothetical protein